MTLPVDPGLMLAFLPVALALNLTPGPDMLFCLGQGLRGGPRPALAAALGVSTGVLVHVLVAGLGLAALLAAWPGLFEVIRWFGVGYLVWIAVRTLRTPMDPVAPAPIRPRRAFLDAMAVNLLNPKVALFVLALLPQFVDPAAPAPVLAQFLTLGAVLSLGGILVNGTVGLSAGGIGRRLARSPGLERWLRRLTSALFLGLAARLALDRR